MDPAESTERAESTLVAGAFVLVFTYVFLANSWIGDDAFITFRVVDNFVHGYGLTFNPAERVQAYTHPLWMLLLSAAYVVKRSGGPSRVVRRRWMVLAPSMPLR